MKTAMDRAQELMSTKMSEVPELAIKFVQHLIEKIGVCSETWLLAYCVYAQEIEGLKCDDPSYKPDIEMKQWFEDNFQYED